MDKEKARDFISKNFSFTSDSFKINSENLHLDSFKSYIKKGDFLNIGSYVSMESEVSTRRINEFLMDSNFNLFLPKIDDQEDKLNFILCSKGTKFKKNSYQILEPLKNESIHPDNLDLVIVPLRAFNKDLKRLGFGGGCYDKTFHANSNPKYLGLAYDFQFLSDLKVEDFDLKLTNVITETKLF